MYGMRNRSNRFIGRYDYFEERTPLFLPSPRRIETPYYDAYATYYQIAPTYDSIMQQTDPFENFMQLELWKRRSSQSLQSSIVCILIGILLALDVFTPCDVYKRPWLYTMIATLAKIFLGGGCISFIHFLYSTCRTRQAFANQTQHKLLALSDEDEFENDLMPAKKMKKPSYIASTMQHFTGWHYDNIGGCVICKTIEFANSKYSFVEILKSRFQLPVLTNKMFRPRDMYFKNFTPWACGTPQYYPRSPLITPKRLNYSNNSFKSRYNASLHEETISDVRGLQQLMRKAASQESNLDEQISGRHDSAGNSFWKLWGLPRVNFETPIYQFATVTVNTPNPHIDQLSAGNMLACQSHLLKGIAHDRLVQYVANLRRWLSKTIVERVCDEIDAANMMFKRCGLTDVEIGYVGLLRLRKMAESLDFVQRYLPTLPLLYRFLNLCTNQTYLVQRIRKLANGSCLADFNWNSVSNQKFTEHQVPSDPAILFHLFCVYMDSQLMPMPQGGSERPFYSQYVIFDDGKLPRNNLINSVKNRSQCAIVYNNVLSPKFSFICDGRIQNCVSDCNNLFYVIIQFIIYLRKYKDDLLEGVNIGVQGINIACVID